MLTDHKLKTLIGWIHQTQDRTINGTSVRDMLSSLSRVWLMSIWLYVNDRMQHRVTMLRIACHYSKRVIWAASRTRIVKFWLNMRMHPYMWPRVTVAWLFHLWFCFLWCRKYVEIIIWWFHILVGYWMALSLAYFFWNFC